MERLVAALRGAGVYEVPPDPLPPTCYPFVIPKSSEKVSLILSCVKQNKQVGSVPPTFQLDSWVDLARALSRIYSGFTSTSRTLSGPSASHPGPGSFFLFRPGLGLPAVELGRLPFSWKYSPYFCPTALARVLQGVLPLGMRLVHYLDDFLLVYTDEGVLQEAGRATVRACVGRGRVSD